MATSVLPSLKWTKYKFDNFAVEILLKMKKNCSNNNNKKIASLLSFDFAMERKAINAVKNSLISITESVNFTYG